MAQSDKPGDPEYGTCHVRAEFFAEDVGWVPVDVSYGLTTKNDYFGNDAGDHLVQHVDLDLTVNAGPFGRQDVQVLQDVRYWVSGNGSADGTKVQITWKVSPLPLTPAPAPEKPMAADAGDDKAERLATIKLRTAREQFEAGKLDRARELCEQLVKTYPKTKAAEEARLLLQKLDE
jgi:hypothetical protein